MLFVLVAIASGCGSGGSGASTQPPTSSTGLTSITITPAQPFVAAGTSIQLIATGNNSDGTTQDLTKSVTWSVANSDVAHVSNDAGSEGLITGIGVGGTGVNAVLAAVQGSASVTVTAATLTSITIDPVKPSLAKGTAQQLTATGNFSDSTTEDLTNTASWTSSDNGVAQVSDAQGSKGLLTGVSVGGASITATVSGVQGTTPVTVTAAVLNSITVDPGVSSIAKGTSQQLTGTGDFSDGTTEDLTSTVSWTSADSSIAVVSSAAGSAGLVTGEGQGTTSINATLDGIQGSAALTVTAAVLTSITISPINPSISNGTDVQLTATGNFSDGTTEDVTNTVSWTSANAGVEQVSNVAGSRGRVTGLKVGSVVITATTLGLHGTTTVTVTSAALTSITIDPVNPSVADGTVVQLSAIGNFSDGTTEDLTAVASWTSADNAVAQADNAVGYKGLVTGVSVGSTSIMARFAGVQGATTVSVTPATLVSITVTPANLSLAAGTSQQLAATANFSDGTTQDVTAEASWQSSAVSIVQVSNAPKFKGLATAKKMGTAVITAQYLGVVGTAASSISP